MFLNRLSFTRRYFSRRGVKVVNQLPRPTGGLYLDVQSRILDTDIVSTTTAKGKIRSMRALVVSGNGRGAGGFGMGKGESMAIALYDARRKSLNVNNWITVDMTPCGRLTRDSYARFKGTKVMLRGVKQNKFGLTCSRLIFGICEVIGIRHITAKRLTRKRSPYTYCNAVFEALGKQVNPESAAILRGGKADYSTRNLKSKHRPASNKQEFRRGF